MAVSSSHLSRLSNTITILLSFPLYSRAFCTISLNIFSNFSVEKVGTAVLTVFSVANRLSAVMLNILYIITLKPMKSTDIKRESPLKGIRAFRNAERADFASIKSMIPMIAANTPTRNTVFTIPLFTFVFFSSSHVSSYSKWLFKSLPSYLYSANSGINCVICS